MVLVRDRRRPDRPSPVCNLAAASRSVPDCRLDWAMFISLNGPWVGRPIPRLLDGCHNSWCTEIGKDGTWRQQ